MPATIFGEHLKRERELRGVSLDEISAATRIKTTFLEALESGRWEELPGGAFNRGFIRATSQFLGLDEDGMIAEYALETGAAEPAKLTPEPVAALPRDYRPVIVALLVVTVLLGGLIWLGHHEYWIHKQKQLAAATESTTAISSSSVAEASPAPSAAELPPIAESSAASTAPDAAPTTNAAPAAAPAALKSESSILKLKIEAIKRTDVKIVGDGKTLFKGRLHSDSPKTFEAKDGFEVTAGEADRLQLQLNGQNIAFPATNGRHGSISLDRKDLNAQQVTR